MTEKRLYVFRREMDQLFYSMNGATIFFKGHEPIDIEADNTMLKPTQVDNYQYGQDESTEKVNKQRTSVYHKPLSPEEEVVIELHRAIENEAIATIKLMVDNKTANIMLIHPETNLNVIDYALRIGKEDIVDKVLLPVLMWHPHHRTLLVSAASVAQGHTLLSEVLACIRSSTPLHVQLYQKGLSLEDIQKDIDFSNALHTRNAFNELPIHVFLSIKPKYWETPSYSDMLNKELLTFLIQDYPECLFAWNREGIKQVGDIVGYADSVKDNVLLHVIDEECKGSHNSYRHRDLVNNMTNICISSIGLKDYIKHSILNVSSDKVFNERLNKGKEAYAMKKKYQQHVQRDLQSFQQQEEAAKRAKEKRWWI